MSKYNADIITILGPTASGKTPFAAQLAYAMGDAEIISADSRMVYRGMTIGSGKDLADYIVQGQQIPYHLIDICEPGYRFNVVDAIITNFHVPKSTLLMLVSAFANRDIIMAAYNHAIAERYRFFSFGDAMFLH